MSELTCDTYRTVDRECGCAQRKLNETRGREANVG
jgi:hypothetical protein